jgi:hypothetical protein
MTIYPDTNIWNALCDQAVDPAGFGAGLSARNVKLVLSFHTVNELLRTFQGSRDDSRRRGMELFSYIGEHLKGGHILGVHEILEIMGFEMSVANRRSSAPNPFVSKSRLSKLTAAVQRHAAGDFGVEADEFVNERRQFSAAARLGQKEHIEGRPDIRDKLRAISEEMLPTWLEETSTTPNPDALSLLSDRIRYRFNESTPVDSLQYANALIQSPTLRFSKASIRADLYYNWRCANRGSNSKDLYDDMYHVLEAAYCDAYVTKEPGQAKYAHLVLTKDTTVHIYSPEVPIDQWLEALAIKQQMAA